MTTNLPSIQIREVSGLPDDLTLYIGKKTLVMWILEAIEDLRLRGGASQEGPAESDRATKLTLLAYCYATGLYASGDIQLAMQHEAMIRYLCARNFPDPCEIRAFRRHHREEIGRALAAVLHRVWDLRFWAEDAVSIGQGRGTSLAGRLGVKASPDFRQEAERRLTRAVRMDCMALDE